MKNLLFVYLLFFVHHIGLSQLELNGKVKSIYQFKLELDTPFVDSSFYSIVNSKLNNFSCFYDSSGNCLRTNYFRFDSIRSYQKYSYNFEGKLIESRFVINEKYFSQIHDSIIYRANNVVERLRENRDGVFLTQWVDSLDENLNLTNRSVYRNGVLNSTLKIEIEDSTKTYLYHNLDGSLYSKTKLVYNNKEQLIERYSYVVFSGQEKILKTEMNVYNELGLIARTITNQNDIILIVEYSYICDDKGNWIRKIVYENGIERFKLIRSIEYY